jgi:general stress protein 26
VSGRRDEIAMSGDELLAFLQTERTVVCATNGRSGWPHLMPLWYVLREAPEGEPGPRLWAWTYARSQKVRNVERDPRATLQVEAGEDYSQLRGVMIECEVTLHRDTELVGALGRELFSRYGAPVGEPPLVELPEPVMGMIESQAAKRVVLEFRERRRASWDHRKLGGVY